MLGAIAARSYLIQQRSRRCCSATHPLGLEEVLVERPVIRHEVSRAETRSHAVNPGVARIMSVLLCRAQNLKQEGLAEWPSSVTGMAPRILKEV